MAILGCLIMKIVLRNISKSLVFQTFVEMLTLFSCMCMMASDTLTETESAASSMLNGPSNFSEIWYRASERKKRDTGRDFKDNVLIG